MAKVILNYERTHERTNAARKQPISKCFLLFLFLFTTTITFAQHPISGGNGDFIEIITSSGLMSSAEQARWNAIMNDPYTEDIYHVNINPIGSFLKGKEFEIKIPGTSTMMTFDVAHVKSSSEDDYYWYGYSADGSIFEMMKMVDPSVPNGGLQGTSYSYRGNITLINEDYSYKILDLSSTRKICVKYDYHALNQNPSCNVTGDDDDDGPDEVEDRSDCPDNNIRVLFLHNAAAAMVANPTAEANLTLNQLNATAYMSNVLPHEIRFSLAGVEPLTFIQGPSPHTDISKLTLNTIAAQDLRDAHLADIVVLFVEGPYPGILGIAAKIKAKNVSAYCIADIMSTAASLTAAHEVSHLMGARHERCNNGVCSSIACDNKKKFHGFPLTGGATPSETMMSNCSDRTSVTRWSNDETAANFMGAPSGDSNNDNVRIIRRRADNVACFRDAPPPSVNDVNSVVITSSVSTLCLNGNSEVYNGSINQANLTYPLTYTWEISPIGIGNYSLVSSSSSNNNTGFYALDPSTLPPIYDFMVFLRLTITDATGASGHAIYPIDLVDCLNGEVDNRSHTSTVDYKGKILVYPNPATDKLQFSGLKTGNVVSVFDTKGNLILSVQDIPYSTIDIASWPTGLYIIKIQDNTDTKTLKFCKI